jgi:hypothetical protein
MVSNSTNINKPKESLLLTITIKTFFWFVDIGGIVDHHCSNFLLFCWYWRNCWPSLFKLSFGVLILAELLTIKESFNSDGQQFLQYQQPKRKFEQWWSTFLPISTNQKKDWTVMVNNSSNINKPKERVSSDGTFFCFVEIKGNVDYHCLNFLLFCWYW